MRGVRRPIPLMTDAEAERFLELTMPEPNTGCWLWLGRSDGKYGVFSVGNGLFKAHRLSYRRFVGPIPVELDVDHVRARGCSGGVCVNPDHLEAVTTRENVRRGVNAIKTECLRGHPLTGSNVKPRPHGRRECRTCDNLLRRIHRAERKAAA